MKGKKTLKDYLVNVRDYISNISKGVKITIAAGTLLGMVSTAALSPLHAEEVYSKTNENGYKIEATIDVVPFLLQAQGLEEKMGASGKVYDEWSSSLEWEEREEPLGDDTHWEETENYGTELNPIKVNPGAGPKTLIKPQISIYTPSKVGFHIEGWQLSGSDSKSGEVPGLFSGINIEGGDNSFTVDETLSAGLVSMWDQIFSSSWYEGNYTSYPYGSGEDEFKYYPEKAKTKYECSRDFKILNGSLSASIPVVPTIRVLGGLRFNLFEINDMQRVQSTFHSEVHETYNYLGGSYDTRDYIFNNNMDLKVNSSIKGRGLGPMVGLAGSKNITDWLRVYGNFSKSWVRMKIERTANFSGIDDTSESYSVQEYDFDGNLIHEDTGEGTTYLESKIPFTVEQTHNVSQTELNFGLEFLLGKHVTLSAGYWENIMQSVPKPAKFHYIQYSGIDDPNLNKLGEYEVEAKDISTRGFKIGVGIKY